MALPTSIFVFFVLLSLSLSFCLQGAGKTVKETETHPYVLRDKVCSPGGTTIYGIHALDKAGFNGIIVDAVEASTLRCKVIAQGKQEKK